MVVGSNPTAPVMKVNPEQLIFTDHAVERYFQRILSVDMTKDRLIKEISHKGIRRGGSIRGAEIVSKEKKPAWVRGRRVTAHYLVLNNGKTVCPVVQNEDKDKWIALTTLHKQT